MKTDHSDKVFADAENAKGPLDKPEKKATDGVSEEKKETEWVWVRWKDYSKQS